VDSNYEKPKGPKYCKNNIDPIKFDTKLKQIGLKWNINGTILAISGLQFLKNSQGEEKESCVLQFWDPYGTVSLILT
jgi:hypothetical protein